MIMSKGDLVVFYDKTSEDEDPYWSPYSMGPPYSNKLGLILRSGGVKSSYIYFFGMSQTDQRIWNLSHHYLKLISKAD
jgi:hypothetical protein